MAYLRAYIDACAAYGWSGGPEFKTRIVEMASGRERRNAEWSNARHRFTLPFLNIDNEKYRAIKQHHLTCRGMLHAFLYRDPLDNIADNETFGIGDGVRREFQLSKLSVISGVFYQRNVYALPDAPSDLAVTVDGVPTTAFTVDRDRGVVLLDSAPALNAVLRWSGQFVVWVRFNQDWLPFSIDSVMGDGFAHNGDIELIEVAAPEASS